jgi:hypothetical protein
MVTCSALAAPLPHSTIIYGRLHAVCCTSDEVQQPFSKVCYSLGGIGESQEFVRAWRGQPTVTSERDPFYETPCLGCGGRSRSSRLVTGGPCRVDALRHRGRLLSRSCWGDHPLRTRRPVCSPSKPARRSPVQQRRVWRSYPRRSQGVLPVLLKHFPHYALLGFRF